MKNPSKVSEDVSMVTTTWRRAATADSQLQLIYELKKRGLDLAELEELETKKRAHRKYNTLGNTFGGN